MNNDAGKQADSNPASTSHVGKFVSPGIILFIDQLIVAIGGWAYWLVISKFASTTEIGHATAIYSLVLLITTLTQLGLEYPLLRKSHLQRKNILGTVMAVEMIITAVSVPFMLFGVNNLYQESIQDFAWLAFGILVFSSIFFVSRFALLGISDAKNVLIFDILGTFVKFVVGFALVFAGLGTLGILVSFLLNAIVIAGGTLLVARRSFSFHIGDIKFVKEIVKDGLVNMPSKLSRMFILSLSVVLLALFGVSSAETGIFYIAVMISIAAGGFASSIAFMAIPASSVANLDLSSGSMRLGLSFTAPIISALLTAPGAILSIIGTEYAREEFVLLVLAGGILPSAIASNAISKFNNLGKPKELILLGSIQLVAFFASFFVLVPQYGILGAAYSMSIAFSCSAIPSVILSEKSILKYIAVSIIAIVAGWILGYLIGDIAKMHCSIAIIGSVLLSFGVTIKLGNVSIQEIRQILHVVNFSKSR